MKTIIRFDGDYRFLSNYWRTEINYEFIKYPSSENAYQAAKTMDADERNKIADLKANDAKKAGKKVALRSDWEKIKDGIMLDIVRIKFSNPDLAKKLLDTGDAILVEGNHWHDKYWGVCYCDECNGVGENKLGEILMKVREELKVTQVKVDVKTDSNAKGNDSDILTFPEI